MSEIIIYPDEASIAGLAEQLRADSRIQYFTPIEAYDKATASANLSEYIARAQSNNPFLTDIHGLYPTFSVLASTVWNINDDVLSKEGTWAARNTPVNKPTNVEHDEHKIVGHMTESWVVDAEGKAIAEDTPFENLPEIFHVCNSAVIYTNWQDPELVDRTRALLEAIKSGEMFVSMECIFRGFHYAIQSPNGEFYKLARSSETAFLTKHLRRYGGSGFYQDHKLGRYLDDFVFSAKGYVRRPANPDSVIFSHGLPQTSASVFVKPIEENPFKKIGGVSIDCSTATSTNSEMESLTVNETELQAKIDELTRANEELQTAIATKDAELAAKAAELTAKAAEQEEEKKKHEDEKKDMKGECSALEAKVIELNKAKASLETDLATAKNEILFANRVATLVDGGVDKAEAKTKVEVFATLTDEQFTAVAAEIVKAAVKPVVVAPVVAASVQPEEVDTAGEVAAAAITVVAPNEPDASVVPGISAASVTETRELLAKALQERRIR